jgi:hypothetical protein
VSAQCFLILSIRFALSCVVNGAHAVNNVTRIVYSYIERNRIVISDTESNGDTTEAEDEDGSLCLGCTSVRCGS